MAEASMTVQDARLFHEAALSRLTAANRTVTDGAAPTSEPEPVALSSPLRLMWWRFRKNRMAVVSLWVVLGLYLIAAFAPFFAAHPPDRNLARYASVPPQAIHLFHRGPDGLGFRPHVLGFRSEIDRATRTRRTVVDPAAVHDVGFFVRGEPYMLLGVIPASVKFIGPVDPAAPFYLLGADRLGRDVLSRIIHGAQVSLTIGLIGVALSLVLGLLLGGVSGYFGGWVDSVIQRVIEFLQSLPTIPLWMGLAAAIPAGLPPLQVYLMITVILSLVGWTSLAREVRGRFMSLRTEDFVVAARLDGAGHFRTIRRHMAPSFTSHIIATVTLAIPGMILAETALSFLGIGLRPPVVSWGVLLQDAQNIRALAQAPWLLFPGLAVVITVLGFNFLGDGLRDAADPYAH
jgi:peptide/nickel transport system permease protein